MYDRLCEYNGKKYYLFKEIGSKIRLFSYQKEDGFKNVIEDGEIQDDYFYKDIKIKELTLAYLIKYAVDYKGVRCMPMALDKGVIKRGNISIITENPDFAKKYDFKKFDKMEYIKKISNEEVENLHIEMTPIYNKNDDVISKDVDFCQYINDLD